MKLSPALIAYISEQIVWGLAKSGDIQVDDHRETASAVQAAIRDDLQVEDRLNEEVRDILRERADEMTRMGVQYHDMFRMIKAELVRKRNLIL